MKKSDVKIGSEYMTKVSGELVKVRVYDSYTPFSGPTRFRAWNTVTNRPLAKGRTAAALHPVHEHTVECAVRCRGD